jgi:hypothetical protein
MLMAAFDQAWDLLKALIPMEGEEGLPENELRHYLNYMRQKEIFTPKGRKKPQVMGEGAKVRSVADVQADIDSRIGTGQGGMLELLTERDKAPSYASAMQNLPLDSLQRLAYQNIKDPYGKDMQKAAIKKAFAVLKNMGGAE